MRKELELLLNSLCSYREMIQHNFNKKGAQKTKMYDRGKLDGLEIAIFQILTVLKFKNGIYQRKIYEPNKKDRKA